jgi:hypothetical protein
VRRTASILVPPARTSTAAAAPPSDHLIGEEFEIDPELIDEFVADEPGVGPDDGDGDGDGDGDAEEEPPDNAADNNRRRVQLDRGLSFSKHIERAFKSALIAVATTADIPHQLVTRLNDSGQMAITDIKKVQHSLEEKLIITSQAIEAARAACDPLLPTRGRGRRTWSRSWS